MPVRSFPSEQFEPKQSGSVSRTEGGLRASAVQGGSGGADRKRLAWPSGVLKDTSTLSRKPESCLVINAFQLKSLILAQSERWRRG
jgi:hypothetical protein